MNTDITQMSDKWKRKEHLKAALAEHLTDTQKALASDSDTFDKEMADMYLISKAYKRSQLKDILIKERLKRFQQTSSYPPLA